MASSNACDQRMPLAEYAAKYSIAKSPSVIPCQRSPSGMAVIASQAIPTAPTGNSSPAQIHRFR